VKDVNRRIRGVQRELVPLTTGLVIAVKKNRTKRLRDEVRRRRHAAIIIQVTHYFMIYKIFVYILPLYYSIYPPIEFVKI
jgi:hypothetical protein